MRWYAMVWDLRFGCTVVHLTLTLTQPLTLTLTLPLALPLPLPRRYKPVERKPRRFNPLVVPKQLQAALPFKSTPKDDAPAAKGKGKTAKQGGGGGGPRQPGARVPVVLEPHEKKEVGDRGR